MQEVVRVNQQNFGAETVQTVNARELHEFLEVKSEFRNWIKNRIADFDFVENQDFVTFGKNLPGGGKQNDYHLTLDMAKELSMVERTEKGKQARLYFIECERRAKAQPAIETPEMQMARGLLAATALLEEKNKVIEVLQPKAAALDRLCDADGKLCIRDAAKALKLQQQKLVHWLLVNRWLYRDQKGKLRGYANMTPRFIIHKITPIPVEGEEDRVSLQAMITPEGLTKLSVIFAGTA